MSDDKALSSWKAIQGLGALDETAECGAQIVARMEQPAPSWHEVGVSDLVSAYVLEIGSRTYEKAATQWFERFDEFVERVCVS